MLLFEYPISDNAHTMLAGVDTTGASLETLFLALSAFPEVYAQGQAEIDRVVGRERLPTFEDMSSLPYITAIVKEVLR